MGFPRIQAAKALHFSGNTDIEAAINWIIDHENEPNVDPIPMIAVNIDIDSPRPAVQTTGDMEIKAQELRNQARKMKEDEEKRLEREREKNERRRVLGLPPSASHTATIPSAHDKKNYVSVTSVSDAEQMMKVRSKVRFKLFLFMSGMLQRILTAKNSGKFVLAIHYSRIRLED
uniref:UBA domain-containing protein n=1 Tax=Salix viminalis TaxID=40686 RepID=A0A6N2LE21_SALVM